ncbi:MAG: sigma-70 family RNA polymerase sigma factor [Kineosporiaceae bacterium]
MRTALVPAPRRAPGTTDPAGTSTGDGGDALVLTHLPVVGHVVAETMSRVPAHVAREDLASAGLVALVAAARAYRADTGVPFGQYARIRIRGAVVDELRRSDWATRGVRRDGRRLAAAEERLHGELGRSPTRQELASALGVPPGEVDRVRADRDRALVVALDPHPGVAHGTSEGVVGGLTASGILGDLLVAPGGDPEAHVAHAERIGALLVAVSALPERLRAVVDGYDLRERPMAELAAELGVTESRVSQMRAQALDLLRAALDDTSTPPAAGDGVARRRRDAYVAAARGAGDLRSRVDAGARALGAPAVTRPRAASDQVTSPRPGAERSGGPALRR